MSERRSSGISVSYWIESMPEAEAKALLVQAAQAHPRYRHQCVEQVAEEIYRVINRIGYHFIGDVTIKTFIAERYEDRVQLQLFA